MLRRGLQLVRGRASARAFASYAEKRAAKAADLSELVEVRQAALFAEQLEKGTCPVHPSPSGIPLTSVASRAEVRAALQAGMATFALHVEARQASALGEGFYTIGPCGEELLAAVGLVLRPDDAVALHYRHLATQVARHARPLVSGSAPVARAGAAADPDAAAAAADPLARTSALAGLFLDRARGYCVSASDPVTGGAHCALGGGPHDFLVTSTLASQATPAVGRALAPGIMRQLGLREQCLLPPKGLSYCSLGDGSVNNAHFLSAANTAAYAAHRGYKCPVLFGISDNGLCISLQGHGWLPKFLAKVGLPVFKADGCDLASVFSATRDAAAWVRRGKPAVVVYENVPRRFGHAATDRQGAYLTAAAISEREKANPLGMACAAAVDEGLATWPELVECWRASRALALSAFEAASAEPKLESLGAAGMVARNHVALPPAVLAAAGPSAVEPSGLPSLATLGAAGSKVAAAEGGAERRNVMRKHMTTCIEESLKERPNLVYLGEDVEHGGYYLVTDQLAKKFPGRVRDVPPDETSLVGVAHGLAQSGLLVVCEIPYAKYLDCGADMFTELMTTQWLANHAGGSTKDGAEQKKPLPGLVIRLQGFDRGVFGGNFHTHNQLPLHPGLDVVVFSNGADWVKGWRHALDAAAAGRVVMVVDSTDLLNRRHLDPVGAKDAAFLVPYPKDLGSRLGFGAVLRHDHGLGQGRGAGQEQDELTIVTYGTGLMAARAAQRSLVEGPGKRRVGVLEVPCVSAVPEALGAALGRGKGYGSGAVLFADPCKLNTAPLLHFAHQLKDAGALGKLPTGSGASYRDWALVASANTYNPLGSTVTFLSDAQVTAAAQKLLDGL